MSRWHKREYTLDHDEVEHGKWKHPDGTIKDYPYEEQEVLLE